MSIILLRGTDLSVTLSDGTPLFSDLNFSFGLERVGLVGRNGIGKSTLLHLLAGRRSPTRGSIVAHGRVALLEQDPVLPPDASVTQALGQEEALQTYRRVLAGDGTPDDLERLDGLWDLPERIAEAMHAVDLGYVDRDARFEQLSGGERTRVQIARLLLSRPDFVLLDEPTNHLDRRARAAVHEWVRGWRKGLLVVSHDRELLEQMDRIALLDERGLHLYGGNFSFYRQCAAAERAAAEQALRHARKELARSVLHAQQVRERQMHRQADGKRRAVRAGASPLAIGIMKRRAEATAARLGDRHAEQVEASREAVARARARVIPSHQIAVDLSHTEVPERKRLLDLQHVNHRYPGAPRALWDRPVSLTLMGPERLALTGPNGSGKSTLLAIAAGRLAPSQGSRRIGASRIGELDQHVRVLDPRGSLLDNLRRLAPSRAEEEIRLILARFLFDEVAVRRPAALLSGGERMRAGLACMLCQDQAPEMLLLDEPTNHLDLESSEEAASVLRQFRGALVVVSHDEEFLNDIGITRTLRLDPTR